MSLGSLGHDTDSALHHRGRRNHLSGLAAEAAVERVYRAAGLEPLERRWRGRSGEIDLVFLEADGTVVFVEVKTSRDFDSAMALITPKQIARLHAAGEEYVGLRPQGQLTERRFDAALVDGQGRVQIEENALLGY
ncbi:YraN family protein [Primorskyibacter aestuariivivens]|uniref:YraN family protein n=1 Tax=Primorskyibacter aestuariivivens TaxID=1888912 RepID=UPI002300C15F|nr:YraN family protein [Primorskyibacter aestuariivivens]MDA7429308.1 YraN family protein [Primorskyibacter aestuariivivens]